MLQSGEWSKMMKTSSCTSNRTLSPAVCPTPVRCRWVSVKQACDVQKWGHHRASNAEIACYLTWEKRNLTFFAGISPLAMDSHILSHQYRCPRCGSCCRLGASGPWKTEASHFAVPYQAGPETMTCAAPTILWIDKEPLLAKMRN